MPEDSPPKPKRREPREKEVRRVWAAAAGRCTFCNRHVLENEDLGAEVTIGELAHNVGWGENSPRGESELTPSQRAEASNLILLCRTCHKPIDDGDYLGVFTVERLTEMKREHEERIRVLTDVRGDRKAWIVRVVGNVRGASPDLSYSSVLDATIARGFFPARLPDAYKPVLEMDLRSLADEGSPSYFATASRQVDALVRRVGEGIAKDDIHRLAVFAFARIPLLIYLGAKLDDKVETLVFQRQRVDTSNPWTWPDTASPAPAFEFEQIANPGTNDLVALVLNLSGTIPWDDIPADIRDSHVVYVLGPTIPHVPGPSLISSPEAVASLEEAMRRFLAHVEADHGRLEQLCVFPAVPQSAAIAIGRVLMPSVSPALLVYDRDRAGSFVPALRVSR